MLAADAMGPGDQFCYLGVEFAWPKAPLKLSVGPGGGLGPRLRWEVS